MESNRTYTYPSWWMTTCDSFDADGNRDHEGDTLEDARQCTWDGATTEERHEAQEAAEARELGRFDTIEGVTPPRGKAQDANDDDWSDEVDDDYAPPVLNADGTPSDATLAMFGTTALEYVKAQQARLEADEVTDLTIRRALVADRLTEQWDAIRETWREAIALAPEDERDYAEAYLGQVFTNQLRFAGGTSVDQMVEDFTEALAG